MKAFSQLPKQCRETNCYLVRLLFFYRCMKMCVAFQTLYVRCPEVLNYIRQGYLVDPQYYFFAGNLKGLFTWIKVRVWFTLIMESSALRSIL